MNTTMSLATAIGLILLGLIYFTDSVLNIRQKRRDQGDDPRAYL